jgi:hypothetical protein
LSFSLKGSGGYGGGRSGYGDGLEGGKCRIMFKFKIKKKN